MLPPVGGAEDAAVGLGSGRSAQDAGKNNVGIGRVDDDASDAAALGQTHVGPGFAGIGGFVDSIAHYVAVADHPGFAGSCPDRAWIRRRYCEGADGGNRLFVKDRCPMITAIDRFPDTSRGSSRVVSAGIAGHAGYGRDAIAYPRAYEAEAELASVLGVRLLRVRWKCAAKQYNHSEIKRQFSDDHA